MTSSGVGGVNWATTVGRGVANSSSGLIVSGSGGDGSDITAESETTGLMVSGVAADPICSFRCISCFSNSRISSHKGNSNGCVNSPFEYVCIVACPSNSNFVAISCRRTKVVSDRVGDVGLVVISQRYAVFPVWDKNKDEMTSQRKGINNHVEVRLKKFAAAFAS